MRIELTRFANILILCIGFAIGSAVLFSVLLSRATQEGISAYDTGRVAAIGIIDGKITGKLRAPSPPPATAVSPSVAELPASVSPAAPSTAMMMPMSEQLRLNPAPNEALLEQTPEGAIPKVAEDGSKPWIYYRRANSAAGRHGSIAIIITGIGLKRAHAETAITLPADISLAFSAYTPDLNAWMMSARAKGHEFMLEMPMEMSHYPAVDSGPLALMTTITPEENIARLHKVLAKTSGYVGLVAPRDEVYFAAQKDFLKPLIDDLVKRGILMIFAHNEQRTVLDELLATTTLPHMNSDVKIEYAATQERYNTGFESLESIARERGHAIGVIEFSPKTIEFLVPWLNSLQSKGFTLVPISTLAKKQFS